MPMDIFSALPLLSTAPRWIIAYSGGVDSHVLLKLAVQAAALPYKNLLAVHINHGLNPAAERWAQHCKTVCKNLGVNFITIKVVVNRTQDAGLAAAARTARYLALADFVQAGDALLTAHHEDDQAETLLLQLLRGAGLKGLASMPTTSRFALGYLVRPLLSKSRAEIVACAQRNKLAWIEDDSNTNQRFDRNFLRHTIFPLLQKRWPAVNTVLARSAQHCADGDVLLMKTGREDYRAAASVRPLNVPNFLHTGIISRLRIPALLKLPFIKRINALRVWLQDAGQSTAIWVTETALQHIVHDILLSRRDAAPLMRLGEFELRRFQNELIVSHALSAFDSQQIYAWDLCSELVLSCGTLSPNLVELGRQAPQSYSCFSVRFRQGGEHFRPRQHAHSHSLKKFLHTWAVPPWLRGRIPLLYGDDRLIAVLGYAHED